MGGPVCSATWCSSPAIGRVVEIHEVPEWRRPPLKSQQIVLEDGETVYYCSQHYEVAKNTSGLPVPLGY